MTDEQTRAAALEIAMIGATVRHLKQRIDYRLNDHLCEMTEGYDDSIVGFNEAWDIVRAAFKEAIESLPTADKIIETEREDAAMRAIADGELSLAEMRASLADMIKIVRTFFAFCDNPKRPCGEYGVECPISMGEWITESERAHLATAEALARGDK